MMKENRFDDIIRNKLSDITPITGENAWAIFEEKWQAEKDLEILSEDMVFDKKVKDELSSFRPKHVDNRWSSLKDQLITIESRKNSIFVAKTLEFAAMLLIVFTFYNLSGHISQNETLIATNNIKSEIDVFVTKTSFERAEELHDIGITKRDNINLIRKDFVSEFKSISGLQIKSIQRSTNILLQNFKSLVANLSPSKTEQLVVDNIVNSNANTSIEKSETSKFDSNISSLNTTITSEVYTEMAKSFSMTMSFKKPSTQVFLSTYASEDVNLINTPFDKLYSLASYDKEALSNSIGMNISFKKGNVEFETGLGYAKRIYQPEIVTEAYGQFGDNYFEKSLKTLNYDIINIPLNIKYHFINQPGWNTYVMAGVSLNLLAKADYDITETLREGRLSNRFTPSQARLDEKNFTKGILHSGSFTDNYFGSLGFGFGIEKSIYKSTSIYIQPSYFRHIISSDIGIGPNKDKIHIASFQFGIKTRLQ